MVLRESYRTHLCLCVSQVNLLPEVMEAFSDAGGGLCQFYTRSHLTGESEESNRKHVTCPGEQETKAADGL